MTGPPPQPPVWPWSKGAIKAFVTAATRAGQRFHVPSGLDAALLVDLPELCQALARFRVDLLTGSNIAPRVMTLKRPKGGYEIGEDGSVSVQLKVTRKLMLDLMALEEIEEPAAVDPSTNGAAPPNVG